MGPERQTDLHTHTEIISVNQAFTLSRPLASCGYISSFKKLLIGKSTESTCYKAVFGSWLTKGMWDICNNVIVVLIDLPDICQTYAHQENTIIDCDVISKSMQVWSLEPLNASYGRVVPSWTTIVAHIRNDPEVGVANTVKLPENQPQFSRRQWGSIS